SAAFILEEGFPIEQLERIVDSLATAARAAGVPVVTGDTKVVDRGKGDGVYINTAGIGVVAPNADVRPRRIRAGDIVLVNGDVGRHGIAVMAMREGLEFETTIESDSAPVIEPVMRLIDAGIPVHCLRDLTRGGLASALNELAADCDCAFELDESEIPVRGDVQSACELLGLDPLYVACEGRFVAFVPADHADRALELLRGAPEGEHARIVGRVVDGPPRVVLRTRIGATRIVDMLSGQQLPRIC
ncbi:MAG: hydrogenase expression/formation protein HypE, partial [Planctomycetota bacterium]